MEKRNLISKIISMIFNLGFMVFIIVQLSMQVEYTSQIVAMFMMLSGAFKLIFFFLSGEYKHPVKLYETLTNPALIILGIIFMIAKTDAVAVCITYGVIDMIDGLLGIGFRSIEIRNHALSVVEVALCLGDFVFGLILLVICGCAFAYGFIYIVWPHIENRRNKKKECVKKSKKKVPELFGGNPKNLYLCIRFPKGTAQKDEH